MSTTEEFRQSCGLCMEPYSKRRIPKILPCFHSFCLTCLAAVVSQRASATGRKTSEDDLSFEKDSWGAPQPRSKKELRKEKKDKRRKNRTREDKGKDKTEEWDLTKAENFRDLDKPTEDDKEASQDTGGYHGVTFLCPTCRLPVTVPKGGIAAMQTNFYLDPNYDPAKEQVGTGPLCEICEKDQEQPADYYCCSCQQRMCRPCRRLHDHFSSARDHRVQSVRTAAGAAVSGAGPRAEEDAETKDEMSRWCQYHPDQLLSFHCLKCKASICLLCKLTSHEDHSAEDMATAVTRIREELRAVEAEASQQLRMLDICLNRLEQDEAYVKRQKQDLEVEVKGQFDSLVRLAKRGRDDFVQALEAREKSCLKDARAEMTWALDIKETLSGLITKTMATRRVSPGPQWVLAKTELQAGLLSDDKLEYVKELVDRKWPPGHMTCRADHGAIDLDLARNFIGQLSGGGNAESDEDDYMSHNEMVTTITKLKDEVQTLTVAVEKIRKENVLFHAVLTSATYVSANYTVIFNSANPNESAGYNTGNGYFTAPVAGTYVFTATLKDAGGTGCNAYLYLNGNAYNMTKLGMCCTCTVAFYLDKGNTVYVSAQSNFTCQANASMFRGHLLS